MSKPVKLKEPKEEHVDEVTELQHFKEKHTVIEPITVSIEVAV